MANKKQLIEWEKIYGAYDKTQYEAYTIQDLPSESSMYHGEIIKWAQDLFPPPKRVLMSGEGYEPHDFSEEGMKVYVQNSRVANPDDIQMNGLILNSQLLKSMMESNELHRYMGRVFSTFADDDLIELMLKELRNCNYFAVSPEIYPVVHVGKRVGTRFAALLYVQGPAGSASKANPLDTVTDQKIEDVLGAGDEMSFDGWQDISADSEQTIVEGKITNFLPAVPEHEKRAGPDVSYRIALNALVEG